MTNLLTVATCQRPNLLSPTLSSPYLWLGTRIAQCLTTAGNGDSFCILQSVAGRGLYISKLKPRITSRKNNLCLKIKDQINHR